MTDPCLMAFSELDAPAWERDEGWPPSITEFSNALQIWAVCQNRIGVTIDDAAAAFNVPADLIRQAVGSHPWMFLEGDVISHEGE